MANRNSSHRSLALAVGLAVVVIGAAALLFTARSSSPKNAALAARQHSMEKLGERIAKLRPDCKVLVLSNPFTKKSGYLDQKNQFERAGLSGLRKGLSRRSTVKVVFPEIRPEFFTNRQSIVMWPDSRTPLSFLMQPESVDQLAEANPECQVIVSLIGLPTGVDRLKIWGQKDPRCFALLLPDLRVLGPPAQAEEAFQKGKLLAAVTEDLASGDPLIVTRENVAEVLQRKPKALGY
jgi:hypothetical protein